MAGKSQIDTKDNPNLLNDLAKGNKSHLIADNSPVSEITLEHLQSLSKEQLIDVIKLIGAARWAEIALFTKEETAEAMKLKLAHIGLTAGALNWQTAITAIEKWLDRQEGKPAQTINNNNVNLTIAQLVDASYDFEKSLTAEQKAILLQPKQNSDKIIENER
jgi:hypothetical protein